MTDVLMMVCPACQRGWLEEECFEHRAHHESLGLVGCDAFCAAPEYPVTLAELTLAVAHWRSHKYLYGCSHGR